jgi:hypothetical protein
VGLVTKQENPDVEIRLPGGITVALRKWAAFLLVLGVVALLALWIHGRAR